jgi:hypothetical protein
VRIPVQSLIVIAVLVLTLHCTAWSQKTAPDAIPAPSDITVTTRLDRTAAWVGDRFHYLIMVDYPPAYEFVLDNLTKETVNMDPFQVVDVGKRVVAQKDSSQKLFVDLTLAGFTAGQAAAQIPQFTLYYFRASARPAGPDQAAAESLTVPGPAIAIRSTLPSQPEDIRDAVTLNSWNHPRWLFSAIAWICAAILIIGVGRELVLFARRAKAQKGPDRRKAMEAVRARWISGIPLDFMDAKTCSMFYDESCRSLREYLGHYLDTPTMGLTPGEMRTEMQRLGVMSDLTEKVAGVLERCDRVRYARNGASADPEAARALAEDIAEDMKEILSAASVSSRS